MYNMISFPNKCYSGVALYLCEGVPLSTRDSGPVLIILSTADLSPFHVHKSGHGTGATFNDHKGRNLSFVQFAVDHDDDGIFCI